MRIAHQKCVKNQAIFNKLLLLLFSLGEVKSSNYKDFVEVS